ncbi:MAG: hypothetical protein WCA27_14900 [Candidatus Sulfotelmatobacter sp.]
MKEQTKFCTDPAQEIRWFKKLLHSERKRHGSVEAVLTRTITQQERQILDLRELLFSHLALKPVPKEKQ